MKNLVLILGFIFLTNSTFSQPFIQENKVWNVIECMNFGACITISYKLTGDTIIDYHVYKKLYHTQDTTLNNWYLGGALRETQGKVYITDFEDEVLMYDFSLSVTDTFRTVNFGCPIELILNQIDTVIIFNGEQRQRYNFNGEKWIKGIGCLYGLKQVGVYECVFDLFYDLSCCFVDEEQIFQSAFFEYCFVNTVGLEEEKINQNFTVSPNPFSESTTIRFEADDSQTYELQIINETGQIVRTYNNIISGEIKIVKGKLKSGLYFFRIRNNEISIASGKIMIN